LSGAQVTAKRSGLTNFSNSFKPKVRLRDKPCRLHKHYRNALRQVVSRLDYLAGLDGTGERFVYATIKDLNKHCKDYETGKPYSQRMLEACLTYLHGQKVIGDRNQRARDDEIRSGVIVAEHDKITEIINGKFCVFCTRSTHGASVPASVRASVPASVPASVENEKCFGVSGSKCFGPSEPEPIADMGDTKTDKKFCKDDFESFARLSSVRSGESIESSENIEKEKPAETAKETAPTLCPDLTKRADRKDLTVGNQVEGRELTLESLLDLISDGEFETPTLQKYEHCPRLKDACLGVVERFKDEPMTDRTICVRMFKALMNACERAGFPWPRGCPKVRKILEQGGPIHSSGSAYDLPLSVTPLEYDAPDPLSPAGLKQSGKITEQQYNAFIQQCEEMHDKLTNSEFEVWYRTGCEELAREPAAGVFEKEQNT
jgi:hypothetical protein